MNDTTKQAFSALLDGVKQLIALSTGVLTLVIAFKDKTAPVEVGDYRWLLIIGLFMQLASICAGVLAIYGVVTVTEKADVERFGQPAVFSPEILAPTKVQVYSFVIGLAFLFVYFVALTLVH